MEGGGILVTRDDFEMGGGGDTLLRTMNKKKTFS